MQIHNHETTHAICGKIYRVGGELHCRSVLVTKMAPCTGQQKLTPWSGFRKGSETVVRWWLQTASQQEDYAPVVQQLIGNGACRSSKSRASRRRTTEGVAERTGIASSPLKMGLTRCHETSATNQTRPRNNAQTWRFKKTWRSHGQLQALGDDDKTAVPKCQPAWRMTTLFSDELNSQPEIWSSHSYVYEDTSLVGYYDVSMVNSYRRFGRVKYIHIHIIMC